MVLGGGVVGRSRVVLGGRVVLGLLGVLGLTLVGHISDVAGVAIVDRVGHGLDAAVGKGNRVGASGGIAVTGLSGIEVDLLVLIVHIVVELVLGGLLVLGLRVVRGRLVVCRGGVVGRGRVRVVSHNSGDEGKEDNGGLGRNIRMLRFKRCRLFRVGDQKRNGSF